MEKNNTIDTQELFNKYDEIFAVIKEIMNDERS